MAGGKKPSQEDIELFRRSAGITRPLGNDRIAPFRKRPPARARKRPAFEDDVPDAAFSDAFENAPVSAGDTLFFARPGVQHRQLQRLRRGRLPVAAELDMHGMSTAVARNAIAHFIGRARDQQLRCVRIIHGKGYSTGAAAPILKNRLNTWLRQHHDVLAFSSTPGREGGTGAVYVLLRSH